MTGAGVAVGSGSRLGLSLRLSSGSGPAAASGASGAASAGRRSGPRLTGSTWFSWLLVCSLEVQIIGASASGLCCANPIGARSIELTN